MKKLAKLKTDIEFMGIIYKAGTIGFIESTYNVILIFYPENTITFFFVQSTEVELL